MRLIVGGILLAVGIVAILTASQERARLERELGALGVVGTVAGRLPETRQRVEALQGATTLGAGAVALGIVLLLWGAVSRGQSATEAARPADDRPVPTWCPRCGARRWQPEEPTCRRCGAAFET